MASWFSTMKRDPYGTLNPEQVQVNKGLGNTLLNQVNAPTSDYMYQGQLNAPMTQGTQDVVNNNARFNAVANPTFDQLATYNPEQFNQDFNREIQDPTFSNFKQNIEPYLGEELPSFGTARANVVARSLNDLQNNVLQQRFTSQQAAKQMALNAIQGKSAYDQNNATIQDIPRGIQQAGLDREYQNFVNANQQKQNSLNQALQFLGISTGSTTQQPTNFGNILTAGQAAGNIYSSFMSAGGSAPLNSGNGLQQQTAGFGGGTSNAWNTNGGAARAAAVSPNLTFAAA